MAISFSALLPVLQKRRRETEFDQIYFECAAANVKHPRFDHVLKSA
jgi:hypothetical protein